MTLTLNDLTRGQDLARRDLTAVRVRAATADTDTRTVTGIGVPYGEELVTPWFRERFEPGACDDDADALAYYRHRDPIGLLTAATETDTGREVTLKLSEVPTADEALTLARDGVIRSLSIGFEPLEWREEHDDDHNTPLIVHTKVRVREYSLVPFPAYETATITSVRAAEHAHKENPMPDTPKVELPADLIRSTDLDTFAESLRADLSDDIRRAQLGAASTGTPTGPDLSAATEFRSAGDFLKALVSDRTDAERKAVATALYRNVVTGDIPLDHLSQAPGFIGDLTKKVAARRKWINRFTTKPLPDDGMSVSYIRRESHARVAEQKKELDPLVKGSGRSVTTKTAPVRTFGGAETLSQQVIDRMPTDEIAAIFADMVYAYAEETDQAMAAHVVAELDRILAAGGDKVLTMPADPGAFDWITAIVDAAEHYEGSVYSYTELALSGDVFKALASEAGTDGRPLLSVHQGTGTANVVGTLNLPQIEGNLLNVPVRLLSGTTGRALFLDPMAFEFRESPGAPFRLQANQPLNLSHDIAAYGYAAMLTPHPDALLPIKFGAPASA
ncbi:HK97 family phage prohead protease [Kocuria sp.]|uniref:HK97 family phage prohead protease n=1 Tax=Kocuria sp. TaxID=1871328 RepID=UPI0026DF14F9|nr:HK97 family phage prohead protease [Kocuria sp.]MDO5618025.1 HK97 family phage prohead protease [Kocuria sp.]